ncbi:MAG: hypothetical protein JO089_01400 [Alphaproteobacteria bacterium]|nr:hypothetical protein [Alphaproteobacteria bacterium]
MRLTSRLFGINLLLFCVASCAPSPSPSSTEHYDVIASGKVEYVGEKKLILQDKRDVIFINLDASDKELKKRIKKGEQITLLGQNDVVKDAKGHKTTSAEIDEIVLENGTHIPIGK